MTDITTYPLHQLPSPCFILSEARLKNNLELLKRVQQESGAKVILALKGFAMPASFPLVKQYLPGATASSLHEAMLANELGGEVHAYSPAWVPAEAEQLLKLTDHISFNSLQQYRTYASEVEVAGVSAGLRINPEYSEVTTDLYNPCVPGSRLGVTSKQLRASYPEALPKGVEGLHFHTLCESSAESLEKTLQAVEQNFGQYLYQVKWLNMGGGHAITREGYNTELLVELVRNIAAKYQLEVILEPGSAVGWQTGWLTSTVLDIVENDGVTTAMLDTSFAAHMPDTLEMPYKPHILSEVAANTEGAFGYNLGGLTCLAGDFIPNYYFVKKLAIGDVLVFDDMMHYTTVKTTTFNGVNLPAIGKIDTDGTFTLLKSYGYNEYKSRLG